MSSAAPLEARLQAVMRSWPQPINPGCEHQLMRLTDRAARRMAAEGRGPDAMRLDEAEAMKA